MKNPKQLNSTDHGVSRRIRAERLNRRMTQVELAKKIGVSSQQVQHYEGGASRVGAGRLVQIAQALGIPVRSLFDTASHAAANGEHGEALSFEMLGEPGAIRLLRAFTQLPKGPFRRAVIDLLEEMVRYEQSGEQ